MEMKNAETQMCRNKSLLIYMKPLYKFCVWGRDKVFLYFIEIKLIAFNGRIDRGFSFESMVSVWIGDSIVLVGRIPKDKIHGSHGQGRIVHWMIDDQGTKVDAGKFL